MATNSMGTTADEATDEPLALDDAFGDSREHHEREYRRQKNMRQTNGGTDVVLLSPAPHAAQQVTLVKVVAEIEGPRVVRAHRVDGAQCAITNEKRVQHDFPIALVQHVDVAQ